MKRYILIIMILLGAATAMAQSHVSDLVVSPAFSGGTIKWYTAGGTLIGSPSTTALVDGATYLASQTVNGVESSTRFAVTAHLEPQGSLTANGPFCVTGAGQLTWTKTAGSGQFTIIYNDGVANHTATSVTSGTPFAVFTTPITTSTTYTLVSVQDANCTRSNGFTGGAATIYVSPLPTLTGADLPGTYCDGETARVNLYGLLDNSYFKVDYTIDGVAKTSDEVHSLSDVANFTTASLTATNNGKILRITGITNTGRGCNAPFAIDLTMKVRAISTATAIVNSSINAGESVLISGTSTTDDLITIYKNGSFLSFASPSSGVWVTSTGVSLIAGDKIRASITEQDKCEGPLSTEVVVQ